MNGTYIIFNHKVRVKQFGLMVNVTLDSILMTVNTVRELLYGKMESVMKENGTWVNSMEKE